MTPSRGEHLPRCDDAWAADVVEDRVHAARASSATHSATSFSGSRLGAGLRKRGRIVGKRVRSKRERDQMDAVSEQRRCGSQPEQRKASQPQRCKHHRPGGHRRLRTASPLSASNMTRLAVTVTP
jgi:hypothetical protein